MLFQTISENRCPSLPKSEGTEQAVASYMESITNPDDLAEIILFMDSCLSKLPPDMERASGYRLLQDALNQRQTKIYDMKLDASGNEVRIYQVTCHPVMVNVAFRDLLAMEKEQAQAKDAEHTEEKTVRTGREETRQRPSVLQKLKANQNAIAASDKKPPAITHDKKQLE